MKKLFSILLITLSLLLLFSCGDQAIGIIYSIEQERNLDDNTLPNNIIAGGMTTFDDNFILAASSIYSVDIAENADYHNDTSQGRWSATADTYNIDSTMFSLNTFSLGADLYCLMQTKNASDEASTVKKMYRFNTGTNDWDEVTTTGIDYIEDGVVAGNYFYFTSYSLSGNTRTYRIGRFDGTTAELLTGDIATLSQSSYFDAATDGTDVYISFGANLFSGTEASTAFSTNSTLDTDGYNITGLHYSIMDSKFFAATSKKYIFSLDGSTWTSVQKTDANEDEALGDTPTDFCEYTVGSTNYLLIGTNNGYYERTTGEFAKPSATTTNANYLTLDLSSAQINSLYFYDGTGTENDVLFALTHGTGLWSLRLIDGNYIWNQE